MRRLFGVLIAIALGLGIFALWPLSDDEPTPRTEATGTTTPATPTTTTAPASTTSAGDTTTTAGETSHVVETVAEAEEILQDLWYGWFEGIYNEDEDRIREVVVLEDTVDTAKESFGSVFERAPRQGDISFSEIEILWSDTECLALWAVMTLNGFREGSSSGVQVIRWEQERWKRLSLWEFRNDLWNSDCESSLS